MATPETQAGLQGFLSMMNYLRKFTEDFIDGATERASSQHYNRAAEKKRFQVQESTCTF